MTAVKTYPPRLATRRPWRRGLKFTPTDPARPRLTVKSGVSRVREQGSRPQMTCECVRVVSGVVNCLCFLAWVVFLRDVCRPTKEESFPFFSPTPSLFLSLFPGKLRGNRQILGSEPSLRLVGAQNQPNFRPNRQNAGNFAETVYLEITLRPPGYFVDFLNFASDFAPDQLSDSGKTASFQNGAPNTLSLFSLEISGNAKCWGPSVFLFVFRKTSPSPTRVQAQRLPPTPLLTGLQIAGP